MTRDRLLKSLVRERFVVTLRGGETFSGLLDRFDANHMELVDASAISDEDTAKVDGRLYLPRAEIVYMQRPEAT